ncbi:MAG: anaerobic sulfatase-maturation protein [Bacteroidetes bacterium]|uniref:Anaerobic sulfatase-maturation protein n=1 Tax=Candidatus Cryptobacteroides intestinigallinarum TaxID=2840767 RepID=A0A9D9MYT3_9BACT|nr:anaerobic sulfatase-maturation protein [Candidatus Cryptobacteroides intestinigallinarum]
MTFGDAMRIAGPVAFNVMIKPAGSLCNLDCRYCYYLDKADIYGGVEPRMSLQMLETCVREYIQANDVPEVTFNWHGGEPLVMGLDFYRKAVALEQKYAGDKTIRNTIQTNGTLIDQNWASFFRDNGFLVGISIDGPADLHDRYRRDKGGAPTFDKVLRGISLLYRNNVEFNTMTTVNKTSEGRGLEVYSFLKSIGSRYMQFMPVVEHVKYPLGANGKPVKGARPYIVSPQEEGASIAPWSVDALAFGKFLTDIFDSWVLSDVGRYFVNIFDAALACWCGVMPGTCAYAQTCGGNSIIEHNGDVYPCDHFVYSGYRLGNVAEDSLRTMMESGQQVRFGISKRNSLPYKCLKCRYLFACNGECPKHRFSRTESGETGLNALCEGYFKFYSHVAPYMDKMKELLSAGLAPAGVMPWARMRKLEHSR